MMHQPSPSARAPVFVALAQLLSQESVDSASVIAALQLIIREFHFKYSLFLESSIMGGWRSLEHVGPLPPALDVVPSLDAAACRALSHATEDGMVLLRQGQGLPPDQARLLVQCQTEELLLAPIRDQDGRFYSVLLFARSGPPLSEEDKTALFTLVPMLVHYVRGKACQQRLTQSWGALEGLLDNAGIDIYVNDFDDHDIMYINQSMAAPYGGKQAFTDKKCWQVLFPGQGGPCDFCPKYKLLDEHGIPSKVYSWDYQRAMDGAWFRVFSAAFRWEDGRLAHIVSSADISDNKRKEALIEQLANYDQLTQLPNRRMLVAECTRRIGHSAQNEHGYILFFDIDGFKGINDTLGHDAGDEFLFALGSFFSQIPLLHGSIYRNGGDEFVALINGKDVTRDQLLNLISIIHARFQQPWVLKQGEIFCNTSVGVSRYPEDGTTVETLLQKADQAMYQVKRAGGGGVCFASATQT